MGSRTPDVADTSLTTGTLVLCSVNNGPPFSATEQACWAAGGTIVDVNTPVDAASLQFLILYRSSPSGTPVVGTYEQFMEDKGVLVDVFNDGLTTPVGNGSNELCICQLPSGLGVVESFTQCQQDGGKVVGKILSQFP